jgi:nitric oxide reductase NorD protein
MTDSPLSPDALEDRLDEPLDPILSSRRTAAQPARDLARFARRQQDFVLRWVGVIAKTNAELAFQFAANAPAALDALDEDGLEAWVVRALDVYDREGLYPACGVLTDPAAFISEYDAALSGASFDEVRGIFEHFLRGLSGRALKLAASDEVYTDTETLYLPQRLSVFADHSDNFRLYKAMASHQWAQTWYGTFRADLAAALGHFDDPVRALALFHLLEAVRLDGCLARDLSGLHREMAALRAIQDPPPAFPAAWAPRLERLRAADAGVADTLAAAAFLYDARDALPEPFCYQGTLRTEDVRAVMTARRERERAALAQALLRLQAGLDRADAEQGAPADAKRFGVRRVPDPDRPDGFRPELTVDGTPVAPPEDVRNLVDSIAQDLGQVPDEFLVPAGDGGYRAAGGGKRAEDVWKGACHEEGAWLYNEWDHRRRHYRKNWCMLRELDVHPQDEPFVRRTLEKYAGLASRLRRSFEALRGEDRLLKKQSSGENVDLDALVEAIADTRSGREMTDRLFVKRHRVERDIAVMFMVDMSGSTKGWINDAEREALVLLCEALEVLGDRYAIYGFSGITRKRCELYRVKRFDEPYGDIVRARIAGITPQDYTRMGVTIRHLTHLLGQVEARTKLLITLSDGKPDDYDGYRGEYGIEDTRQALIEAKRLNIHPFCITIDKEARDYLPHMYGPVNYTLVDDVWKLPVRVSEIYRKLTT